MIYDVDMYLIRESYVDDSRVIYVYIIYDVENPLSFESHGSRMQ